MIGNCPECNSEVEVIKDADFEENNELHYFAFKEIIERIEKYKIPFKCSLCGGIKFKYQAINSYVFVWSDPIEYVGKIIIPETLRQFLESGYGTVLSIGKGYYNKKRFILTEVKKGDRIIYDKDIPQTAAWTVDVEASDGKKYPVRLMPEADIKVKINE
jgi:co-chaperonin GroES (HSP10)